MKRKKKKKLNSKGNEKIIWRKQRVQKVDKVDFKMYTTESHWRKEPKKWNSETTKNLRI